MISVDQSVLIQQIAGVSGDCVVFGRAGPIADAVVRIGVTVAADITGECVVCNPGGWESDEKHRHEQQPEESLPRIVYQMFFVAKE